MFLQQSTSKSRFVCPSCSFNRLIARSGSSLSYYFRASRSYHSPSSRNHYYPRRAVPDIHIRSLHSSLSHSDNATIHESRLASRTAINPPANIPPSNQALYLSLERLKHVASDYVDQSRVQLALRGLESERPTIRVGLLGLGKHGHVAARKLAAILLADPLSEEKAWETALKNGQSDGKALLIRYGAEDDIPPLNPLVDTLCVPSALLQKANLEFLITSLRADPGIAVADPAGLVESMLVPPLQTPVASTGRPGFVRYPVHKAIVVGEGIEGCIDYGRLSTALESTVLGQSGIKERLIQVALSIPRDGSRSVQAHADNDLVTAIDVDQAEAALRIFRQDVANGPIFNTKWQASNIETLKASLTSDTESLSPSPKSTNNNNIPLHPALAHHILSTLSSTSSAITTAETLAHATASATTISETTRASLQSSITAWSETAHTDLQVSLATALASKSWRRTSWTRLLWRCDDVGVAAESLLRNHFLLDAEAGLAFLSGRITQAGFLGSGTPTAGHAGLLDAGIVSPSSASSQSQPKNLISRFFTSEIRDPTPSELVKSDLVIDRVRESSGIDILATRPWPLTVHYTRQTLLHTLVPALQSRAQRLLLNFLTTAGASSALGVWVYVATSGAGLYEGGAVAALGVVWAARVLQRKWENARGVFEGEVREGGRCVLAEVEEGMRGVVDREGRVGVRGGDVEGWSKARGVVREVEGALRKRGE